MSPEQIARKVLFGLESDVWALGCVMAELALRTPLFNLIDDSELMSKQSALATKIFQREAVSFSSFDEEIVREEQRLRQFYGPDGFAFLLEMIQPDVTKRKLLRELLNSPYLN